MADEKIIFKFPNGNEYELVFDSNAADRFENTVRAGETRDENIGFLDLINRANEGTLPRWTDVRKLLWACAAGRAKTALSLERCDQLCKEHGGMGLYRRAWNALCKVIERDFVDLDATAEPGGEAERPSRPADSSTPSAG